MKQYPANILTEYGPFPGVEAVHGLTFDGRNIWFATGDRLNALDPETGEIQRSLMVPAHAGTAFDGKYLFQIAEDRIQKIDSMSGEVLSTLPSPSGGADSGMAWAEGSLWVGHSQGRTICQIDPDTGEILSICECSRLVTGVTWVDGELWHGTWEDESSDIRHVDPKTGEVLTVVALPEGVGVSGLESDGQDRFFCGGGKSGKVRAIARPGRVTAAKPAGRNQGSQ